MASKYNLSRVLPMDYAICGSRLDFSAGGAFAVATRIKTAGWHNAFNTKISTHTGIFCTLKDPISGQDTLYIAEMLGDGLKISSIYKYLKPGYSADLLLGVRRNPVYQDNIKRAVANNRLSKDSYRYDYMGVGEFLFDFIPDSREEFYCSELVQHYAIMDGGKIKNVENKDFKDEDDISPYAIQMSPSLKDVDIGV